jgi:hypothetical protein
MVCVGRQPPKSIYRKWLTIFPFQIPKIIKKDAYTSCFDLINDSNPCNKVLVKNVVIETCSDEIAMENEQLK